LLKKYTGKFLQSDIKDIKELKKLEEEENYQREDTEHSAYLATTTKNILFRPPTSNPLSKS
jgi:hypothetical protein